MAEAQRPQPSRRPRGVRPAIRRSVGAVSERRTRATRPTAERAADPLTSTFVHQLALGLILALAAALRVVLAQTSVTRLDSDQAVTGIMATKILDGEIFAFYAGQHYMGALEQYGQAVALAVFPRNEVALKLPSIVLSVVTCYVVYLVGVRILGSKTRGLVAACLYAVGPYFNLVFGSKAFGAYASAQLVAITGLYLALVFSRDHPHSRRLAIAFGVALGAGYWLNWTSALLLLPAMLWFFGSIRGERRRFGMLAASGFVVGALPAILHAIRHRVIPHPAQGPLSTVFERSESLTDAVLPSFVGLKLGHGVEVSQALPSSVILLVLVGAFGAAVWSRRSGLVALLRGRMSERDPIDPILLGFLLIPVVWLPLKLGAIVIEPRYLFALAPALAIGLVGFVPRKPRLEVMGYAILLLAVAALSAAAVDRVLASGGNSPAVVGGGPVRVEPLRALVPEIERRNIKAVYGDYWIAYVLQFFAGDRFAVEATYASRFPDLSERVERDPSPAYVALEGAPAQALELSLKSAGSTYRVLRGQGVTLFYAVRPRLGSSVFAGGAHEGATGRTARHLFETLASRVDAGRAAALTSSYLFRIEGAGTWLVDAGGEGLSVSEGGGVADCVITTSTETLELILSGKLSPTTAYSTGQIEVRGDLSAALKLLELL